MLTNLKAGDVAFIKAGSICNFFDESGNHWIHFDQDTLGLVIRSYPFTRNGIKQELFEVLISGDLYEVSYDSLRCVS
jgi:hypothetical protein